ncbi:MAG: carboxypeptidase regulatory-like domain-containing protein [Polyangiaceae bacterium]
MLLAPIGALFVARALIPGLGTPAPPPSSAAPIAPPTPAEDRTPEILGRILDADGKPVDGAAVRVVSPRLPYAIYTETKSDAAGKFSFERVASERVRVVADHDPDGAVTSTELHLAPGQSTEITLVLSAASAVRGTVVDADDRPVARATLFVEGVPWIARGATSEADGSFRLPMVPDGVTSLVAVARGYKTARVSLPRREDSVELVVRVRLVAGPAVDGDVRDPDGNPIRARIVACEGQPSESTAVSAEDGTFELPASTIGCDAVAEHDEYEASQPVALVEGRRVSLRLRPGGAIEGVVVDDRGASVASFTVGIESFSGAQSRSLRGAPPRKVEDPYGSFRLERLAPGRYVLTAGTAGRPPGRSGAIDVTGGSTTTGVRIVLPAGGSVIGHVFDEHHMPLEGVDLHFDAVSSVIDSSAGAQSDGTGRYRLDGAPTGPFTLRAQKAGYRIRMLSGLYVESHAELTKDVTLNAVDGGAGLEFGGIGANVMPTPEGLAFGAVFAGDPAERAGLRAGDRILGIDAESTDGMSVSDALQRLRGEAGTSVAVSVQRPKTGETVDVVIERLTIVR